MYASSSLFGGGGCVQLLCVLPAIASAGWSRCLSTLTKLNYLSTLTKRVTAGWSRCTLCIYPPPHMAHTHLSSSSYDTPAGWSRYTLCIYKKIYTDRNSYIHLVYLANIHVTFSVVSSHRGFATRTVCLLYFVHVDVDLSSPQPKILDSLFSFFCVICPPCNNYCFCYYIK